MRMLSYGGISATDADDSPRNQASENSSQFSVSNLLRLGRKRVHDGQEEGEERSFALHKKEPLYIYYYCSVT